MTAVTNSAQYPARLQVDYPEKLDRLTSFFRVIWIIPIAIILALVSGAGQTINNPVYLNAAGEVVNRTRDSSGGLVLSLALATALMIVFRQSYPRWWFDFARELTRFST